MSARPLVALGAAVLAAFAFQSARPPRWHASLEAALRDAEQAGALVLCQFTLAGRPLSARAEQTLAQPELSRELKRFACVRLDAAEHAERFAAWVGGGPGLATCVLSSAGEPLAVQRGYVGAADYGRFLTRARTRPIRVE